MTIKKFIEKLEGVAKKYGADVKVVMADGIPVVNLIYLNNFVNKKSVVITDQK